MRFNAQTEGKNVVKNYEGDKAYSLSPELELYTAVCCASLQPKFYQQSVDEQLDNLRRLINQCSPEYVAKLAIYAREQMYLRSVPLVVAVELAKRHSGDTLVSKLTQRVIQRADEITEMLAYYQLANARTGTKTLNALSTQVKKGIASAFHKFDEYQFAKYNRDTEVKLRDALFITHPKPKDEKERALFKKIVENKLEVPYTWEVELSQLGQQSFVDEAAKKLAFKRKWEELIDSKKLGYMATLRNLRNMLNAGISQQHVIKVAKYLAEPENVKRSKQLPFRFLSAYRELGGYSMGYRVWSKDGAVSPLATTILNALEDAAITSASNIAGYDYDTTVLIASDVSGSMQKPISPKSKVMNYDIGLMLSMLLQNRCKSVITGIFGERWIPRQMSQHAILSNVMQYYAHEGEAGYATNGYLVLDWLIQNKIVVDTVMMFTDCQMWDSTGRYQGRGVMNIKWQEYRRLQPTAKMYLFDLSGYGSTPIFVDNSNVHLIAGWSDKVFDVLAAIEKGETAIDLIQGVEL